MKWSEQGGDIVIAVPFHGGTFSTFVITLYDDSVLYNSKSFDTHACSYHVSHDSILCILVSRRCGGDSRPDMA